MARLGPRRLASAPRVGDGRFFDPVATPPPSAAAVDAEPEAVAALEAVPAAALEDAPVNEGVMMGPKPSSSLAAASGDDGSILARLVAGPAAR